MIYTFFANAQSTSPIAGLGQFAITLNGLVHVIGQFISTASLISGVMCLFASFLFYMEYRVNRHAKRFSSVVTLIVLGLVLLAFPLINVYDIL